MHCKFTSKQPRRQDTDTRLAMKWGRLWHFCFLVKQASINNPCTMWEGSNKRSCQHILRLSEPSTNPRPNPVGCQTMQIFRLSLIQDVISSFSCQSIKMHCMQLSLDFEYNDLSCNERPLPTSGFYANCADHISWERLYKLQNNKTRFK